MSVNILLFVEEVIVETFIFISRVYRIEVGTYVSYQQKID